MIRFIIDMIRFPFDSRPENRCNEVMTFCFKNFPIYFWVKPGFKRFLLFFVLLVKIMLYGTSKKSSGA